MDGCPTDRHLIQWPLLFPVAQNIDGHREVLARKRGKLMLPNPAVRSHLVDEYQGNALSSRIIDYCTATQLYCRHTVTAMSERSWQIGLRYRPLRG